jgi:hypothetical protein
MLDTAPAILAVSATEIPNLDPYIQVFVLIASAITAVIRLWKSIKSDSNPKKE